jgi:hypothetical protein
VTVAIILANFVQMTPDHLSAADYSALGAHPVLTVEAASWRRTPDLSVQSVIIGVDCAGMLPVKEVDAFDVLLTTVPNAPEPWVSIPADRFDTHVAMLTRAVRRFPQAATIFCQTLRLSKKLPFADALVAESLAYSTLLGGAEFRQWRQERGPVAQIREPARLILTSRKADHLILTLNNPAQQNAMTASMRDALYGALANALDDPTRPAVSLRGAGKCFSTGGSLSEFGTADDLARAHIIRTTHGCARLIDALGDRADVHFHGGCVGSGLEIPSAATRRTAAPNAWFQLPELRMGLIPGAGGTASVSRAIGRHRTAWLGLSGKRINARMALGWGLVQGIIS